MTANKNIRYVGLMVFRYFVYHYVVQVPNINIPIDWLYNINCWIFIDFKRLEIMGQVRACPHKSLKDIGRQVGTQFSLIKDRYNHNEIIYPLYSLTIYIFILIDYLYNITQLNLHFYLYNIITFEKTEKVRGFVNLNCYKFVLTISSVQIFGFGIGR